MNVTSCMLPQASQEYAGQLVSAHTDSCPWRDTVCDAKLGKFPKLPARDVYVEFEQRYDHLNSLSHLPPLSAQAVDSITDSNRCSYAHHLQSLHVSDKNLARASRVLRFTHNLCRTSSSM